MAGPGSTETAVALGASRRRRSARAFASSSLFAPTTRYFQRRTGCSPSGRAFAVGVDKDSAGSGADGDSAPEACDHLVLDVVAPEPVEQLLDQAFLVKGCRHAPVVCHQSSSKRIACAPCQRTVSPIVCRCSSPSTTLAK